MWSCKGRNKLETRAEKYKSGSTFHVVGDLGEQVALGRVKKDQDHLSEAGRPPGSSTVRCWGGSLLRMCAGRPELSPRANDSFNANTFLLRSLVIKKVYMASMPEFAASEIMGFHGHGLDDIAKHHTESKFSHIYILGKCHQMWAAATLGQ